MSVLKREEGWYWVRQGGCAFVAMWRHGSWWICGEDWPLMAKPAVEVLDKCGPSRAEVSALLAEHRAHEQPDRAAGGGGDGVPEDEARVG